MRIFSIILLSSLTALNGYGIILPGIEVEYANVPQELLNLDLLDVRECQTGSSLSFPHWWTIDNGVQDELQVFEIDNYSIAAAGAHIKIVDTFENNFLFTGLTVTGVEEQTYRLDDTTLEIEGTGCFSISDYILTLDFSENLTGEPRSIILELTDNDSNTYELSFQQPDLKPYTYIGRVENLEAEHRMAFNELSDGTLAIAKVWGDYSSNKSTCTIPYKAFIENTEMCIRAIESNACITATGIKTLSLSDMLHHVDSNGFNGLELEELWYMAAHETRPEWIIGFNETAFENAEIASQTFNDCVLYVDSRVYDKVKDAEGWCNFKNITSFANSSGITSVRGTDGQSAGIYTLQGLKLSDTTTDRLPKGIYLQVSADGNVSKLMIK